MATDATGMLSLKKIPTQWKLTLLVAILLTAIAVVGLVGYRATTRVNGHLVELAIAQDVWLREQAQSSLIGAIEGNRKHSDRAIANSAADIVEAQNEVLAVMLAAVVLSALLLGALVLDLRSAVERRHALAKLLGKPTQPVEQSPESRIITDRQGQIEHVNDSTVRINGYSSEELEELVASRTEELVAERDRSKADARVKSDFLANMSHEIRTPINAMMGFSNLCLTLDVTPRVHDYLSKISASAESLLGIVNDVLDVSKMEAGKLDMECIEFDFFEVLERVSGLYKLKAADKGVELAIGAAPQVPERLMGDPFRLGQVLTNLMSNALKFTDRGCISLTVEARESSSEAVIVDFAVRDCGVGMTPLQLSNLFTAFAQADNSITRKYGGTGLGLSICKQLVEHMHGEISVESELGVGSCFRFSARFGLTARPLALDPFAQYLTGKRVLLVEDNEAMRTLLSRNLLDFGCPVDALESGEAALARLQGGAQFDLLLLDWRLPGLDGLAFARNLRAVGNAIPIILVTGAEPEVARAQMGVGAIQAYLSKPVSRSTLHDTLVNVLQGQATKARQVAQPLAAPNLSGRRILLVDDNDFNREIGVAQLEITGATVDTAENGALAVAAVSRQTYDLVLMDIQMPVMDGYSATRILRQSWPDLPILALTAHAMVEEKDRVQAAGMNDILTKPVLPKLLYAALERWLAKQPVAAVREALEPEIRPD
jgi:signal transduction histidine kinase/DNA-binding response OmpR family regulator